jgi:hypothetical protein
MLVVGLQPAAQAGYVHHLGQSGVKSVIHLWDPKQLLIIDAAGRVWEFDRETAVWTERNIPHAIPVPIQDVEWWGDWCLITRGGDFWWFGAATGNEWQQAAAPWVVDVPDAEGTASAISLGNHPNPFTPSTSVAVHVEEPVTNARIVIFDAHGHEVRRIPIGDVQPIEMTVAWDGHDDAGMQLPAGVYLYRLVHDSGASEAAKAVILR